MGSFSLTCAFLIELLSIHIENVSYFGLVIVYDNNFGPWSFWFLFCDIFQYHKVKNSNKQKPQGINNKTNFHKS